MCRGVARTGRTPRGVRLLVGLARDRLDLFEDVVEDRADQRLLGREAAVQRAFADAGAAGDLLDPDVEARLGERGSGGVEDAGAVASGVGPQWAGGASIGVDPISRRGHSARGSGALEPSEPVRSVRWPWQSSRIPVSALARGAQRRAARGRHARRRAPADPRRGGDGQDDDAVLAGGLAGVLGRAVGASAAVDVHAPGVARDAAAGARAGARFVAGAGRDLSLRRASAGAPARRGAGAAARVRRARRG